MTTVTVYKDLYDVEIDVDLSDVDTADLVDELDARGYSPDSPYDEQMRRALYRGEDLTEIVRDYLRNKGYAA